MGSPDPDGGFADYPVIEHQTCRSCKSPDLIELFSLGEQYPSDFPVLRDSPYESLIKIPITLDLCRSCTLVQQRFTAPSDFLYTRHYWYRSGVTDTMQAALRDVVSSIQLNSGVVTARGDIWLDIGANDGTLLEGVGDVWDNVIRVACEPASNLRGECRKHCEVLIPDFWSVEAYDNVMPSVYPSHPVDELPQVRPLARIVTACGMFYDLEDPNAFIADVKKVLHPNGVFVAQLQCLKQTVELGDVGNLCHEHLEFYSLKSLILLFGRHGIGVVDVEENKVNGGSYRITCRHLVDGLDVSDRVTDALLHEENVLKLHLPSTYHDLYQRMLNNRDRCVTFIREAVRSGKRVWVYGASTKGNVILQWYGLDSQWIEAAADRSREKWGKLTVGTGIRIVPEYHFRDLRPDYALVLPYAFLPEFIGREKDWLDGGGKFLVPLPEFRVVS